MTVTNESKVYYDPYDFDIDTDPYPVWKRLRDEAPLYYNEKYDFFALSRYDDVDAAMLDWQTYISGRGRSSRSSRPTSRSRRGHPLRGPAGARHPPRLLSRVFTPKKMQALEPQVRAFCAAGARPAGRVRRLRLRRRTWARFMPMRVIGMLLGIPEQDQAAIRDRLDEGLRIEEGVTPRPSTTRDSSGRRLRRVHRLAGRAPLRRPDDRIAQRRVRGRTGTTRTLTRDEMLDLRRPPRRGRQRDHDPADRLDRQGAGRASRPARRARGGPLPDPERHRGAAALRAAVARAVRAT